MRLLCPISFALLQATAIFASPAAYSNATWDLEKRDFDESGWERCPLGQRAEQNSREVHEPDGCGTGRLAGLIPGSSKFHHCCIAHDTCFVGCENSLDKCNDPFAQCMTDTCAETGFLGWLSRWVRPKCEGERKIYEAVVRGKKGKEHYKKDTEKFCDCVDSPPITIKRSGKIPILAYNAGVDDGKTYEGPNPTIPVVGIIDGETITFQPTFRPTGA